MWTNDDFETEGRAWLRGRQSTSAWPPPQLTLVCLRTALHELVRPQLLLPWTQHVQWSVRHCRRTRESFSVQCILRTFTAAQSAV